MAGMLAGVETARKRRIHQSSVWSSSSTSSSPAGPIGYSLSSRRSTFSLLSTPFMSRSRTEQEQEQEDEKLGRLAREAKERLDERLRTPGKSQIPRKKRDGSGREERMSRMGRRGRTVTEVVGSKKKGGNWKQEEEECAVCLEEFRAGEEVANLECCHRFHSSCLLPWLHTNALCPCCRSSIFCLSSSSS